jgi:choloylglycine hydrolase
MQSYTPNAANGMKFTAKYGVVGLCVVQKEFIAEGINEAGLSTGLFFFPNYGSYLPYNPAEANRSVGDLQLNAWMLSQFATVDEVITAINSGKVRVIGLDADAVVHYRIGDKSGRQVVLEFIDGVPHFYENTVGVITNAPGFEWHLANLDNYVNLRPGSTSPYNLGEQPLKPIGGSSAMLGLPGDFTPPSRFVRAAFFRNTAPQRKDGHDTVLQAFHILNNFDVPIAIENPDEKTLPSATHWTSAIDLSARKVYYKTAYNNTIRQIDLKQIDFTKIKYQSHLLDDTKQQPIQNVTIK